MRLMEIASAEEQLALWKLINDSVWAAVNQQARDEAARKAAAQRAAKLRGGKRRAKVAAPSVRIPSPPPAKKAAPPPPPQQQRAGGAQQPSAQLAPTNPRHQPTPTAAAQPQQMPPKPLKPAKNVGFSARNTAAAKKW